MKRTMLFTAAGLALMAGGWMGLSAQPDESPDGMHMPDPSQMMAMMEKAGKPDHPNHAQLKKMEGDWTITAKFKMDPSAPPEISKGTSKNTLILGGRQLKSEVDLNMQFMGQEMDFSGMSLMGFDKVTQQFQGTWVDSMGTGQMHQTGKMEGETIVMEGESKSVFGTHTTKNVIRFVDGGYDMEFWEKGEMIGPEYMNTGVIEYRK